MSSVSDNTPLTMKELVEQFKALQADLLAVKDENEQLRAQLTAEKSPSPTTSEEKDVDLQALIKALTVQSEKKAKVPKPHEWDRSNKKI